MFFALFESIIIRMHLYSIGRETIGKISNSCAYYTILEFLSEITRYPSKHQLLRYLLRVPSILLRLANVHLQKCANPQVNWAKIILRIWNQTIFGQLPQLPYILAPLFLHCSKTHPATLCVKKFSFL